MDIQAYLTPWNIGSGVAGLLLSVTTIISLVMHRRQFGAALKSVGARFFSQIVSFIVHSDGL
jgi:hypothetical protein